MNAEQSISVSNFAKVQQLYADIQQDNILRGLALVGSTSTLIDLGCGPGDLTNIAATQLGARCVVAVDSWAEGLENCMSKWTSTAQLTTVNSDIPNYLKSDILGVGGTVLMSNVSGYFDFSQLLEIAQHIVSRKRCMVANFFVHEDQVDCAHKPNSVSGLSYTWDLGVFNFTITALTAQQFDDLENVFKAAGYELRTWKYTDFKVERLLVAIYRGIL